MVTWGSRHNERWSSKFHEYGKPGYTLCGVRIPRNAPPAPDSWDMCEKCATIKESVTKSGLTKRAPDVAKATAKCTCPLHPVMLSAQCHIHGTSPRG